MEKNGFDFDLHQVCTLNRGKIVRAKATDDLLGSLLQARNLVGFDEVEKKFWDHLKIYDGQIKSYSSRKVLGRSKLNMLDGGGWGEDCWLRKHACQPCIDAPTDHNGHSNQPTIATQHNYLLGRDKCTADVLVQYRIITPMSNSQFNRIGCILVCAKSR